LTNYVMKKNYIIFTDLDGTLLDHHTYSYRLAQPALSLIKEKKIPLIFVSSKTKDEIEHLHAKMNLQRMPFIAENGAAVFIPEHFYPDLMQAGMTKFGMTYDKIVIFVKDLSIKYGYNIKGYHNITDDELEHLTGLSGDDLKRSRNRLYSLPLLNDEETVRILTEEIAAFDLKILHGGRFIHLLADTDKGKAVNVIRNNLPASSWISIGLGDSPNDLEMLKAVDIPVLIKKHDGTYDKSIRAPGMVISRFQGPRGWNECVLEIIKGERGPYG
jgi:mannosyl-3-phosphoglycerate phosphatase